MTTYMQPSPQFPTVPGSLTFTQFLQSVFAGVSGISGSLVRPKWQPKQPNQPDLDVNWLALALVGADADANAYSGSAVVSNQIVNVTQRMEQLEVQCAFYGPQAYEYMGLVRDGFQIQANRAAMLAGGLAFVSTDKGMRVPDKVNEVWVDRWEMTFYFNREILRSYPVLTFLKASGTIETIVSGNIKNVDWAVDL